MHKKMYLYINRRMHSHKILDLKGAESGFKHWFYMMILINLKASIIIVKYYKISWNLH